MYFFTAELVFRVFVLMCLMTLQKKKGYIMQCFSNLLGHGILFVRIPNKHFML